ncbi:MAG: MaoC/PaaZ C-terminal domain-containing protein [Pseudomonadota bacterium]
MQDAAFGVVVGDLIEISKTLTDADLAAFAELSGDFDPIHMDETYARTTVFGRRVAHGLLTMALLSGTASRMSERARQRGFRGTALSLGYDRVRFVHPVFVGDRLTARYAIEALQPERRRTVGRVEVVNQDARPCVVGRHLMSWRDA